VTNLNDRKAFETWLDFDQDQMQMLSGKNELGDYLHATIAIQWEAWRDGARYAREESAKKCESLGYLLEDSSSYAAAIRKSDEVLS
jgi:hypothetical protein